MKTLDSRFLDTGIEDETTPNLTAGLDCADNEVKSALFRDSAETIEIWGSRTTATAIDCSVANVHTLTIGADLTISFTNPPASGRMGVLVLEVTNGDAYTITWPATIEWDTDGSTAPDLQSAGVDILTFITRDAGATWRGIHTWKEA